MRTNRLSFKIGINELIFSILSYIFISSETGGFCMLLPFINGTVVFGIASILFVLLLAQSEVRRYFFVYEYGAGVVVFLVLSIIYTIYMRESFTASKALLAYSCIVVAIIGAYMAHFSDARKMLLTLLSIEIVFKLFVDIILVSRNPYIMRNALFDLISINGNGLEKMVSAGSLYTFSIVLFAIICYLNEFSALKKLFALLFSALIIYMLVISQFTLILLFTILGIAFIFIYDSGKPYKSVLIIGLFSVVLLLLLPMLLRYVITHNLLSSETQSRLSDTYKILYGGESISSVISNFSAAGGNYTSTEARLFLYSSSISSLTKNFFFGCFTPGYIPPGGHSTWLDYISYYGCLVLVPYYYIIKYIKARSRDRASNANNKKYFTVVALLYLMAGLFNAFQLYRFYLHIYIIVPFVHDLIWMPSYEGDTELSI